MTREELITAIRDAAEAAGDPYTDADVAELRALADDEIVGLAADFGIETEPAPATGAPAAPDSAPAGSRQQKIDAILKDAEATGDATFRARVEALDDETLDKEYKAIPPPKETNPRTEAQKKARAQIDDLFWNQNAIDESAWRALDAWINEEATGDLLAGADRAGKLDARIKQQVGVANRTVSEKAAQERAAQQQKQDAKTRRAFDDAYDTHVLLNARNIAEGRVPATDEERDAAQEFLNYAGTSAARRAAWGRFQQHAAKTAMALTQDMGLFGPPQEPLFTPAQFEAWLGTVGPLEFVASDMGSVMQAAFPGIKSLDDIPGAVDFRRVIQQQVVPFYAPERRTMDAVSQLTAIFDDVQGILDERRDALDATDDRRSLQTTVSSAAATARADAVSKFTELVRSGATVDPRAFAGQELTQKISDALTSTGATGLVKQGDIYGTIGALAAFRTPHELEAEAKKQAKLDAEKAAATTAATMEGERKALAVKAAQRRVASLREITQAAGFAPEQEAQAKAEVERIEDAIIRSESIAATNHKATAEQLGAILTGQSATTPASGSGVASQPAGATPQPGARAPGAPAGQGAPPAPLDLDVLAKEKAARDAEEKRLRQQYIESGTSRTAVSFEEYKEMQKRAYADGLASGLIPTPSEPTPQSLEALRLPAPAAQPPAQPVVTPVPTTPLPAAGAPAITPEKRAEGEARAAEAMYAAELDKKRREDELAGKTAGIDTRIPGGRRIPGAPQ